VLPGRKAAAGGGVLAVHIVGGGLPSCA